MSGTTYPTLDLMMALVMELMMDLTKSDSLYNRSSLERILKDLVESQMRFFRGLEVFKEYTVSSPIEAIPLAE